MRAGETERVFSVRLRNSKQGRSMSVARIDVYVSFVSGRVDLVDRSDDRAYKNADATIS